MQRVRNDINSEHIQGKNDVNELKKLIKKEVAKDNKLINMLVNGKSEGAQKFYQFAKYKLLNFR